MLQQNAFRQKTHTKIQKLFRTSEENKNYAMAYFRAISNEMQRYKVRK